MILRDLEGIMRLVILIAIWGLLSRTCNARADPQVNSQINEQEDADLTYSSTFTKKHVELLKSKTKEMFYHAWDSYLDYGFPYDEVLPISCKPFTKDPQDPLNVVRNDVMGNFSLTVFDNLDTFLIFGEQEVFEKLVMWIKHTYKNFNIDSNVQVFEVNIRVLGGLLSAHLFASDERMGFAISNYDGFLLRLAHDLGTRLLLAFDTKTSIPYPRTNLAKGPLAVPSALQKETCTSGAGSPVLEFTLLSRLTGDSRFEDASKRAFRTLWNSRTELDLVPMTIDPEHGKWLDSATGIGASIDSFYEYALKQAILFNDDDFLQVWQSGYESLNIHSQNGWVYEVVDARTGQIFTNWLDALSAFWPGLQVLSGDLTNAKKLHATYMKLWQTFDAIPERWNMEFINNDAREFLAKKDIPDNVANELLVQREIALEWYPLRPEFIESTYHLYRATRDPIYLQVGQDILQKLELKYMAPCGFAGMLDIRDDKRQDRMESFVLSETLKYLYLLFDEDNFVHRRRNNNNDDNMIFSTEAHPMWFDQKLTASATGYDRWFNNEDSVDSTNNDSLKLKAESSYGTITMRDFSVLEKLTPNFIQRWWNKKGNNDDDVHGSKDQMHRLIGEQPMMDKEAIKKSLMNSFYEENKGLIFSNEQKSAIDKIFNEFYDSYMYPAGRENDEHKVSTMTAATAAATAAATPTEIAMDLFIESNDVEQIVLQKIENHGYEFAHDFKIRISGLLHNVIDIAKHIHQLESLKLEEEKKIGELNNKETEIDMRKTKANEALNDLGMKQEIVYEMDICPIIKSPHSTTDISFLRSDFLSWPYLYQFDAKYHFNLIKPHYIVEQNFSHGGARGANNVELSEGFYKTYGTQDMQSAIYHTTEIYEGVFEPINDIRNNRVSRLDSISTDGTSKLENHGGNNTPEAGDLFVNSISGTRMRIEKLAVGKVDMFNDIVEEGEMYGYTNQTAFRILKINGVELGKDDKLWVGGFSENATSTTTTTSSSTSTTTDNEGAVPAVHLSIQSLAVVNAFIWNF